MDIFKFIYSMIIGYSPMLIAKATVPYKNFSGLSCRQIGIVPPEWLFGIVWAILYFLIGASFFLYSIAEGDTKEKRAGFIFFGIQLALNAAFIPVYFLFHSLFGGFIICILITIFLIFTLIKFYKISKKAAYLLIPYFLWMIFATILSYKIYIANN